MEAKALQAKVQRLVVHGPDGPAMAGVMAKLIELSQDDKAHATQIAAVLSKDQVLTGKLLKLVNSPVYAMGREITSVQQAVLLLGARSVRSVALSLTVISLFPARKEDPFDYLGYWEYSLYRACLARNLAVQANYALAEEAYTVALMLDLGILVLAANLGEPYVVLLPDVLPDRPLESLEREYLGADHGTIGAALCRRWKLPRLFSDVIEKHHDPLPSNGPAKGLSVDAFARYADRLGEAMNVGAPGEEMEALVEQGQLLLGLERNQVLAAEAKAVTDVQASTKLLGMEPSQRQARPHLPWLPRRAAPAPAAAEEAAPAPPSAVTVSADVADPTAQFYDPVTGLLREHLLRLLLRSEVLRARRYHRPFSLALFDFVPGTSTLAGERLLAHVTRLMMPRLRNTDQIGRVGDRRFAVVFVETGKRVALSAVTRIRQLVEDCAVPGTSGPTRVGLRVGGASYTGEPDTVDDHVLLAAAQAALDAAMIRSDDPVLWDGERVAQQPDAH